MEEKKKVGKAVVKVLLQLYPGEFGHWFPWSPWPRKKWKSKACVASLSEARLLHTHILNLSFVYLSHSWIRKAGFILIGTTSGII